MLLYEVTYPHTRAFDRDVSWGYCQNLAKKRGNIGAIAKNTNGDGHAYVLVAGADGKPEWRDHVLPAAKVYPPHSTYAGMTHAEVLAERDAFNRACGE